MAQTHEYKLIVGSVKHPLNDQLRQEGQKDWRPILMSTPTDSNTGVINVYVILERPVGA